MAPINCTACVRYVADHIWSLSCIFNEGPSVPEWKSLNLVRIDAAMLGVLIILAFLSFLIYYTSLFQSLYLIFAIPQIGVIHCHCWWSVTQKVLVNFEKMNKPPLQVHNGSHLYRNIHITSERINTSVVHQSSHSTVNSDHPCYR